MALLRPLANATVSTTSGGTAKLTGVRATIAAPGQKDLAQFGGIVRHVVLLDPGTDIQPGDALTITAWGQHTRLSPRPYHVLQADPEGGLGLEVIRAVVGERVQR